VRAAVPGLSFGGVELTPPHVEFFGERVDPPSMIAGAEALSIGHETILAGSIGQN